MKKLNLNDMSVGDIDKIAHELIQSEVIFRVGFEKLSLNFLSSVLSFDPWDKTFDDIRTIYLSNIDDEEVPENKDDFYAYIVKKFFGYDEEPRGMYVQAFSAASGHLKEIDDRIDETESEIAAITASKINKDYQSKIPVLKYFLQHNKKAREDILEFIKTGIKPYSLKKADPMFRGIFAFGLIPYNYAWNPEAYKVRYPSLISNKFMQLGIKELTQVKKMFETNRPLFQNFLSKYIADEDIVFLINDRIDRSFLLRERADIIRQALTAFEQGNKILFSNSCFFIIEGIFHDVCLLFGINENDLLGAGFQAKLDHLQKRMDIGFNYEYYSFKFRLLRNQMAHGLLPGKEAEEVADLLLLDLEDAMKVADSLNIPLNQKRFFYQQSLKDTFPEKLKYLAAYLFSDTVNVPAFYEIDDNKILEILRTEEFWKQIDLTLAGSEEQKALTYAILKSVCGLGNAELKKSCIDRIKMLGISGNPLFDKVQFKDNLVH